MMVSDGRTEREIRRASNKATVKTVDDTSLGRELRAVIMHCVLSGFGSRFCRAAFLAHGVSGIKIGEVGDSLLLAFPPFDLFLGWGY